VWQKDCKVTHAGGGTTESDGVSAGAPLQGTRIVAGCRLPYGSSQWYYWQLQAARPPLLTPHPPPWGSVSVLHRRIPLR
jgi:hypothetical protein